MSGVEIKKYGVPYHKSLYLIFWIFNEVNKEEIT